MNTNEQASKERITSIDALRAVTLLGILLVHVAGLFGYGNPQQNAGTLGILSIRAINILLSHKCNTIFGILFGVSFYLILRNPKNTTGKFVWRCFILVFIGLFNKLFYTFDALMWYGICGMILACFRNLPVKKLCVAFISIFILNIILNTLDLKGLVFGTNQIYHRYKDAVCFKDVLSYPLWMAVLDYFRAVINGPLGSLSKFLLGYCIAKSGIIENLKKYVTIGNFLIFASLYAFIEFVVIRYKITALTSVGTYMGSFCYATLFLLIYYKTYPFFRFLEPYGKLGLTNYSMQGILGVILTGVIFKPLNWSFELILLVMLLFYIIQVLFSIIWLKHYRYGPLEWLWRCATERLWMKNKIVKQN